MPSSPHPLVCMGSVLSAACIQPSAPPGAEPHVTTWVLALTLGTLCLTNDPSSIPGAHPEPPSYSALTLEAMIRPGNPGLSMWRLKRFKKGKKKSPVRTSKVDEGSKTPWLLLSPSLPVVGGSQSSHVHRSNRHGPRQHTPTLTAHGLLH